MTEKRFEYNYIKGYNDYIYDVTDNRMMWELDCICELLNNLHEEKEIAIEGIMFADKLIEDLGGEEMKNQWRKKFRKRRIRE